MVICFVTILSIYWITLYTLFIEACASIFTEICKGSVNLNKSWAVLEEIHGDQNQNH